MRMQGVKLANGDAPAVDGLKRQREDKAGRDVTQLANRWLENQLIPAINDQVSPWTTPLRLDFAACINMLCALCGGLIAWQILLQAVPKARLSLSACLSPYNVGTVAYQASQHRHWLIYVSTSQ